MTEVSSSRTAFNRRPDRSRGRRQGVRALLPLGIVTVVAAGVALSPELASANPALPPISAQALLTKLAGTTADAYSGTLNVTTNLGLPALPDLGTGANPLSLLSGTHVIQVAANGPDKQRIALLDTDSEYDLIHNGQQVWIYDSEQNSVEQGTLPAGRGKTTGKNTGKNTDKAPAAQPGTMPLTPAQAVQQLLAAVTPTTEVTVASTQNVAGRAAYTLVITPKQSGSLISRVEIAVDAQNGAPLRVALYSVKAPTTPVFQLGFTSVSFSAPADSRFEFTAPKGATVSPLSGGMTPMGEQPTAGSSPSDPKSLGQGWLSVLEVHGVGELDGLNQPTYESYVLVKGQKGSSLQNVIVRHGHGDGAGNVSEVSEGGPNATGLFDGNIQSYLQALGNAGTSVSGAFGSGKLYSTNFVTILITDDGRLFIGAVTPALLEADANAQGTR